MMMEMEMKMAGVVVEVVRTMIHSLILSISKAIHPIPLFLPWLLLLLLLLPH
jgi:hypothetical protein